MVFVGDFVTAAADAGQYGASVIDPNGEPFGNSGAMAVRLALSMGAERVILLGYDCQYTGGKTHWHGSHPSGLGDAASLPKWPGQFETVAEIAKGRAINCSRETALTCFERVPLEKALEEKEWHS